MVIYFTGSNDNSRMKAKATISIVIVQEIVIVRNDIWNVLPQSIDGFIRYLITARYVECFQSVQQMQEHTIRYRPLTTISHLQVLDRTLELAQSPVGQ